MENSHPTPPDIDTTIPSPARMYDYYLGGKDNFSADREAAETALSVIPYGRQIALANRRFLVRAVKYLSRNGIWQFIDLGTGIPTSPNVHEAARSINPSARVVYVDNDPIVNAHNNAILANRNQGIVAINGDIRYPLNIITSPTLNSIVEFGRPVGILFVAVLHFITDDEDPYQAIAVLKERVPSGSYLVISHITSDGTAPEAMSAVQAAYRQASAPAVFRSTQEIEKLFRGFELIKPGLVDVNEWRGNNRKPVGPTELRFLGGVGRKP